TNGEGVDTLDSVKVAQVLNMEFYPIPDAVILPLTSARWHNNIRWVTAANVETFVGSKVAVTPSPVDDAPCSRAAVALEVNRTFVSCEENQTLVCSLYPKYTHLSRPTGPLKHGQARNLMAIRWLEPGNGPIIPGLEILL